MSEIKEPGVLERLADNVVLLTGAIATLTAQIAASAVAPAPAPSTATTASAPASSAGAASPKASKGKKASSSSTAAVTPPAGSVQSSEVVPATSGDMFGEETSEAPTSVQVSQFQITPAGEKPVKSEAADTAAASTKKKTALTADNVRAALVDLQTKAGGRDAVNALLAKHTKNGTSTLSGLNDEQERFKAVIEEAKALVAAAAK